MFDSGIGGLTIVEELRRLAPDLHIDYCADTGFFPYGDKSDEELRGRLPVLVADLVEKLRPDVFVIACNTASTLALKEVRAAVNVPVVGTVPAIKSGAKVSKTGHVGLLATPGTIARPYTAQLITDFAEGVEVTQCGSVELVHLAEQFASGNSVARADLTRILAPLFATESATKLDTIILACTHFPLLREELAKAAPYPVQFVDSGEAIARQTLRALADFTPPPYQREATPPCVYVTSALESGAIYPGIFARFGFSNLVNIYAD